MADPVTRQIPWLRVFVEGVVIVASILLAFGIDAWTSVAREPSPGFQGECDLLVAKGSVTRAIITAGRGSKG